MPRILVVDDDLHTRLAIGIWLKRCGFWVAITEAAQAIGTSRQARKPDSPNMIATEESLN